MIVNLAALWLPVPLYLLIAAYPLPEAGSIVGDGAKSRQSTIPPQAEHRM